MVAALASWGLTSWTASRVQKACTKCWEVLKLPSLPPVTTSSKARPPQSSQTMPTGNQVFKIWACVDILIPTSIPFIHFENLLISIMKPVSFCPILLRPWIIPYFSVSALNTTPQQYTYHLSWFSDRQPWYQCLSSSHHGFHSERPEVWAQWCCQFGSIQGKPVCFI